jgi:hypothetical protein
VIGLVEIREVKGILTQLRGGKAAEFGWKLLTPKLSRSYFPITRRSKVLDGLKKVY